MHTPEWLAAEDQRRAQHTADLREWARLARKHADLAQKAADEARKAHRTNGGLLAVVVAVAVLALVSALI